MRGVGPPSRAWEARVIAVIRHPHIFLRIPSIGMVSQEDFFLQKDITYLANLYLYLTMAYNRV